MKELYNFGFNDIDIENIIEICPEVKSLSSIEINNNIEILKSINCNDRHIRNILLSNPYFLCRSCEDILKLIKKLLELNISQINLLLDSNPFLLNKDSYEIDEYIKENMNRGKKLDDIIEDFEENPFIIDEVSKND